MYLDGRTGDLGDGRLWDHVQVGGGYAAYALVQGLFRGDHDSDRTFGLGRPLGPAEAIANVGALIALPHVRTPGEGEGFWQLYLATRNDPDRGNDVPDGHLVALMRQHGVGTIYTCDRDFRRFDGIAAEDPFEASSPPP